jgi:hypothetical protein
VKYLLWVFLAIALIYILAMVTGAGPESSLPSIQGEF